MAVTIAQICDAIETTLSAATGITTGQSYDELSEGLPAADLPLIQVYWEALAMDPTGGTDRGTFQAGRRQKLITIYVDLFASQRSHVGEDNAAVVAAVDALLDVLEAQDTKDYFSRTGIKAWQLEECRRGVFPYSQATYVGARFTLSIWVY